MQSFQQDVGRALQNLWESTNQVLQQCDVERSTKTSCDRSTNKAPCSTEFHEEENENMKHYSHQNSLIIISYRRLKQAKQSVNFPKPNLFTNFSVNFQFYAFPTNFVHLYMSVSTQTYLIVSFWFFEFYHYDVRILFGMLPSHGRSNRYVASQAWNKRHMC